MPTETTRFGLQVPAEADLFVVEDIAANWTALAEEATGFLSGLASARPAAAASNTGFLYYATDTEAWTLSNGTVWEDFQGPSGVVISATPPGDTDVLWIDTSSTGVQPSSDEVDEGTTNLYFTDARAQAAVLDPFFLMGA